MTPPVVPRPNRVEAGPFKTSIDCVVEHVAVIEAGVAQTIQEIVVPGGEAAQIDEVAMGAAFAGIEGDAGHILEGVLEVVDALFLDHLGRDHIDRYAACRESFPAKAQIESALLRDHDGFQCRLVVGGGLLAEGGGNGGARSVPAPEIRAARATSYAFIKSPKYY